MKKDLLIQKMVKIAETQQNILKKLANDDESFNEKIDNHEEIHNLINKILHLVVYNSLDSDRDIISEMVKHLEIIKKLNNRL